MITYIMLQAPMDPWGTRIVCGFALATSGVVVAFMLYKAVRAIGRNGNGH